MHGSAGSILVVELGHHYFLLDDLISLFDLSQEVEVFVLVSDVKKYKEAFSNTREVQAKIVVTSKLSIIDFWRLFVHYFLRRKKFSSIYFSTGPEHSRCLIVSLWAMFVLATRRRVILNVRNVGAYWRVPSTNGKQRCAGYLRRLIAGRITRFTFETETMRQSANQVASRTDMRSTVMVVRSSGSRIGLSPDPDPCSEIKETIRIGVLGQIDETRKDYACLGSAVRRLPNASMAKIELEFVTQDAMPTVPKGLEGVLQSNVSSRLCRHSEEQMWSRAETCNALISPLNAGLSYGTLKGTGSVGDAIALRKLLILPAWADPNREFAAFCRYYSSAQQLSEIMEQMISDPSQARLSARVFDQYSILNMQKRLNSLTTDNVATM